MRTSRLGLLALMTIASVACSPSPASSPASTPAQRSVMRMEEGFVDANGVLIYYKAFGTGQPLVILQGGPGASHDYFLPVLGAAREDEPLDLY